MNTEYIKNQLISLERRLQVFLTRYQALQEQKDQLLEENQQLKQSLAEHKESLQSSFDKLHFVRLTKNLQNESKEEENTEYSTLIDKYIEKIGRMYRISREVIYEVYPFYYSSHRRQKLSYGKSHLKKSSFYEKVPNYWKKKYTPTERNLKLQMRKTYCR